MAVRQFKAPRLKRLVDLRFYEVDCDNCGRPVCFIAEPERCAILCLECAPEQLKAKAPDDQPRAA